MLLPALHIKLVLCKQFVKKNMALQFNLLKQKYLKHFSFHPNTIFFLKLSEAIIVNGLFVGFQIRSLMFDEKFQQNPEQKRIRCLEIQNFLGNYHDSQYKAHTPK
jgi:hypothetical protein